ncbi:hypothetical protein HMPREF1249_1366 [Jonquetella sp. BV3C21]|nr:hypothetical protein HMPREF1249_1366 [Jonquetella sp. BV3C21]
MAEFGLMKAALQNAGRPFALGQELFFILTEFAAAGRRREGCF